MRRLNFRSSEKTSLATRPTKPPFLERSSTIF